MNKTRQSTVCYLLLLSFSFIFHVQAALQDSLELAFIDAQNLRHEYPDKAIQKLEPVLNRASETTDTVITIKTLMELAKANSHQANYGESYDKLWQALLLADESNDQFMMSKIYIDLGRHYSFYKRLDKALEFFNISLNIKKKLVADGIDETCSLVNHYYPFVTTYREFDETQLGQTYLDSCFMFFNADGCNTNESYLQFEKANLLHKGGQNQEAIKIFERILPWFPANDPAYQVLVYHYMANTYYELENYSESEKCYLKSLDISNTHNGHVDFTPLVHEGLANLYDKTGQHQKAFQSLNKVKELDAAFFDSRSKNNHPLLEIQDDFRKTKEEQKLIVQEQRLNQLEQEEKLMFLQKIILLGCIAFLILFGTLYFKHSKSKHKSEKKLLRKQQELEIQKANEIVELKNRELATSALKLIEKDTFIDELKDRLSNANGTIDSKEIRSIVRSMSSHSEENWKEFEARFISVNKKFYKKLNKKFPNLTQGDQKLCALVKLNFSSKEMAKLLGISVESVHTTRYRLRKKLKLSRQDNLTEYIASI